MEESLAMLEEEFVGTRSWFIGLTDFGHEGRYISDYQKYPMLDSLRSLLDIYIGGSGITPVKMSCSPAGPPVIPGVTTVKMTASFSAPLMATSGLISGLNILEHQLSLISKF